MFAHRATPQSDRLFCRIEVNARPLFNKEKAVFRAELASHAGLANLSQVAQPRWVGQSQSGSAATLGWPISVR